MAPDVMQGPTLSATVTVLKQRVQELDAAAGPSELAESLAQRKRELRDLVTCASSGDHDADAKLARALSAAADLASDVRALQRALKAAERREASAKRDKLRMEEKFHKISDANDRLQNVTRELQAQNRALKERAEAAAAALHAAQADGMAEIRGQIEAVRQSLEDALGRNEELVRERAVCREQLERFAERVQKMQELVELQKKVIADEKALHERQLRDVAAEVEAERQRNEALIARVGEAEAQRAKWVEEIQGRLKQFEDVRGGIQKYQELAEALAEEARVLRKGRAAAAKVAEEKDRQVAEARRALLAALEEKQAMTGQLAAAASALQSMAKVQARNATLEKLCRSLMGTVRAHRLTIIDTESGGDEGGREGGGGGGVEGGSGGGDGGGSEGGSDGDGDGVGARAAAERVATAVGEAATEAVTGAVAEVSLGGSIGDGVGCSGRGGGEGADAFGEGVEAAGGDGAGSAGEGGEGGVAEGGKEGEGSLVGGSGDESGGGGVGGGVGVSKTIVGDATAGLPVGTPIGAGAD